MVYNKGFLSKFGSFKIPWSIVRFFFVAILKFLIKRFILVSPIEHFTKAFSVRGILLSRPKHSLPHTITTTLTKVALQEFCRICWTHEA